jgi:hypothetical protein
MSMHLHHPSLSLNGKKRGKIKFRNAEEAQRARQLDADWQALKKKYEVEEKSRQTRRMQAETLTYTLTAPPGRVTTKHIPSLDTGHTGAVRAKEIPQYTGTKIIGIGTMHKSNAVPIFSDEQAVDISRMRR